MNSHVSTSTDVLTRLGHDRHGIVSRERLLAAGVPASTIKSWVRRGNLVPVIDGIYLVAGATLTWHALAVAHRAYIDMQARRITRVHQVMHVAGVGGVAAAHLHQFPWVQRPDRPYILANRPSRVHPSRVLSGFQPMLREFDLQRRQAVTVTEPHLTLTEAAAVLPERRTEDLLVELPRRGVITWPGMVSALQRFPGDGADKVVRILRDLDADLFATRSGPERDVVRGLRARGVEHIGVNVRRRLDHTTIEFDILVGARAEEIDGPHHLLPSQAEWDVERDHIARRHGIEVHRTTTAALAVDLEGELDAMALRLRDPIALKGDI